MRLITPVTVWRFLFIETLRLMLLTAAIAVVVFAFAASIRFFANGTLGVLETLTIAAILMVPMLQFALPFAGGFAATLVYHRLAGDNETTACYAGGMSHRAVLLPAVLIGLAGGVLMFVMADQVMPRFLRAAQEMVSSDPTKLLTSRLGGGQSLAMEDGHRLLYADDVAEVPVNPGSKAFKHLVLRGVVAVETDKERAITREMSSRLADVWLYRGNDDEAAGKWGISRGGSTTDVVLQLRDPVGGKTNVAIGQLEETQVRYRLPSTFRDDPKYLSWTELERAKATPELLNVVDTPRRNLAFMLAERQAIDQVRRELASTGMTTLIDGSGRPITLRAGGVGDAPGARGFPLLTTSIAGQRVVQAIVTLAESSGSGVSTREHKAERAYLAQTGGGGGEGTTLSLIMEDVQTTGAGVLAELVVPGIRVARDPAGALLGKNLEALRLDARSRLRDHPDDTRLAAELTGLDKNVRDLSREIMSKQHERIAASLACAVMILLGAVMGMKLGGVGGGGGGASPLVVYMWSFLPALGALLSISGGQSATHQAGSVGLILLYGGVVLLAVHTYREYRAVARH